ncbi:MAG TPA: hexitol phosphatase HxpB [Candidatus Dormibacteraeota bacterium]|nr:hexitol phosphatase HxpB [Candidatus Dormibacteraeota bacterium]
MTADSRPVSGGDRLRAVIFDMDGVLIDTEPVWRKVEMEVFGALGVALTEADCRQTMGLRIDDVVELWHRRRPWTGASIADVAARIVAGVIAEVRRRGVAADGARDAIGLVRHAGLRCAVASSSPPALISAVIERLGLAAHVEVTCSASEVARGKPAPDVYLRTARLLGVAASACLAIEDSVNGMLSAQAAGMPCIVIPERGGPADPRLGSATLRLDSLLDLDGRRLESVRIAYFS